MAELVTLVMEPREKCTKGKANKMRAEGFVPCVFYGPEMPESVMGKVKMDQMDKLLAGGHWETTRFDVKLPSGDTEMGIIREVQRHPISGRLVHVDFMRLIKGRKITVNVPIQVVGREKSPGIKDGGVLETLHEMEIDVLPRNIPEFIEVDVSNMAVGDMIYVKDLGLGKDFDVLVDPEEVVAIVSIPKVVEEEPQVEEEEKEVEVVAKGKAAKEDAEAAEQDDDKDKDKKK